MTNKITVVTGGDIETNCYIVHNGSECVLFDFTPNVPAVLDRMGLTVKALFLTHIHFDHFQGLSEFQKTHKFALYLSESGLAHINDGLWTLTAVIPDALAAKSLNVDVSNGIGLTDEQEIDILGMKVKIVLTLGHSQDSACYIIEGENVVFVGDTVFCGGVGRTDLYGGNMRQLYKSKSRLLSMIKPETILYPGHGPETTADDEA